MSYAPHCLPFLLLTAAVAAGCASSQVVVNPAIKASLGAVGNAPDKMGKLIYEGAVFPVGSPNAGQVFSYERRVKEENGISTAIHITRDMDRNTVVTQAAKFGAGHQLQEFEYVNGQTGYIARAESDGKILRFKFTDAAGQISTAEEEITDPVAVGPNLFGLIAEHWAELSNGSTFYLRFAVAEKKQTYRFVVKKISDNNGITRFEMKATNWFIGFFIAPFEFEYDSTKHTIITYQGRVPPMLAIGGKLKELDARVVYKHHAAYR